MRNIARTRWVDVRDEWQLVRRLLPQGWEDKAKELGAIRRLRGIPSVEMALRVLLMHLADGCSLKETSTRAAEAGWANISAVGILYRLRDAERWLAWMAAALRRETPRRPIAGRCVAVDATTITEPGPTGSQWRVHWSVDLASLQCEHFEVTDVHGGEKFARFPIEKDQLVMGDRGYSNPAGIDHIRSRQGHVLVRVNPMSLPLYARKDGRAINVLARVRGMRVGQIRAWRAWVKGPEGRWHSGRLVAVKRSLAATRRALRQRRHNSSSSDRKLGPRGRALARYVLLWTSLPASELSKRQVLWHYRLRWQLELVFKRAKSIMGLGQLPKYSDASSRAWLNGKLLVAMLVEKLWRQAELFSPWGYALFQPAESVA
jgi:hypothetical protein